MIFKLRLNNFLYKPIFLNTLLSYQYDLDNSAFRCYLKYCQADNIVQKQKEVLAPRTAQSGRAHSINSRVQVHDRNRTQVVYSRRAKRKATQGRERLGILRPYNGNPRTSPYRWSLESTVDFGFRVIPFQSDRGVRVGCIGAEVRRPFFCLFIFHIQCSLELSVREYRQVLFIHVPGQD